jgi:aminobenzoyl-glutamate utilization protein B
MSFRGKRVSSALVLVCVLVFGPGVGADDADTLKREAVTWIDAHHGELVELSQDVWKAAEIALREARSSKAHADFLERRGFTVRRGVAGMPTAFVAEFGTGSPVIGILAEYDALPGLSQKAQVEREAITPGGAGHGCGHNLLGTAATGAACSVKDLLTQGKLKGTLRLYGTPAEESVGGKLYMAREKLFDDLDVCLAWHPSDDTGADTDSSQALVDFIVEFHGKTAHAAYDPWNARSAADGAEAFTHGINLLREHVRPTVRMHYTVVAAGDQPNVVPDYAKVWCWVRDSKRDGVEEVLTRVRQIAEGAALVAGVTSRFTIQSGDYELLVNMEGARLVHANMEWLGPIGFTDEEQMLARRLQASAGVPERGLSTVLTPLADAPGMPDGGSTDVGDVSWVVPTLHFSVATAPEGVPWHSWAVVASSAMPFGKRGMNHAAKVLATTAIDLYRSPELRQSIRAEFDEKTRGQVYKGYIPDGPPPLPKGK